MLRVRFLADIAMQNVGQVDFRRFYSSEKNMFNIGFVLKTTTNIALEGHTPQHLAQGYTGFLGLGQNVTCSLIT
jgi:hypothetical protein